MKKLSVLFATLFVVALSVTSCVKKAESMPAQPDTTVIVVDSVQVDSTVTN